MAGSYRKASDVIEVCVPGSPRWDCKYVYTHEGTGLYFILHVKKESDPLKKVPEPVGSLELLLVISFSSASPRTVTASPVPWATAAGPVPSSPFFQLF